MARGRRCLLSGILVFLVAIFTQASEAQSSTQQRAEAELLALHQTDRRAHLHRDVNALVSHAAEKLIDVRDGKVQRLTREEVRKRFADYFALLNLSPGMTLNLRSPAPLQTDRLAG